LPHFSLLCVNAFTIPPYFSAGRLGRLLDRLAELDFDLYCLQEIQQNAYAALVVRQLTGHPHYAFKTKPRAPGGGLLTISRLPFESWEFVPYQDRGNRWSIGFADWNLEKGMLVTRLRLEGQEIYVVNTHTQANYRGQWTPENPQAQIEHNQVLQLAGYVRGLPPEALVIACGDFNFPRNTYLYETLIEASGMSDPLRDDLRPSYRPFPLAPAYWNTTIDYALVRLPEKAQAQVDAGLLVTEDERGRLPWQRFLTDHNALTLKIKIK
jgi:endonuclease/exonuclease/phosphatase family metal-dependent hydrolase